MASLSTNIHSALSVPLRKTLDRVARTLAALRPAAKTPEEHLAAQQRRAEAREAVDRLLR